MKKILLIITLVLLAYLSYAQTGNKYDLLTEQYIKRPYTLHKGLLQINSGYAHIQGNNYFNADGTKLDFNEIVKSIIEDEYNIGVAYGILELLEFNSQINFRNRFETLPTYFVSNIMNFGSENTLLHYRGFSNLHTELKVRTPSFANGFEAFISAGLYIPIQSQSPRQPLHSIVLYDPSDPGGSYELNYEFNPAPDVPAKFYQLGFGARYSNEKIGISLGGQYMNPFSEVETYYWNYRLYGNEFIYSTSAYTLRPKGSIQANVIFDIQLFPWFATYTGYSHFQETPGWSNELGQAVSLTRESIGMALVGFEIQISTHFRMVQQVCLPIAGKNTYSEFQVNTGLVYTIAPLI